MEGIEISHPESHDSDTERHGYNVAFGELGLEWFWDARTYSELQAIAEPKRRIGAYIQSHHPHLLRAYDVDFLSTAVETARSKSQKATVQPSVH